MTVPSASRLAATLRWLKDRLENRTLLSMMAVTAFAWAFLYISDEVSEKATTNIDQMLLLALRTPGNPADPIGPRSLEEAMRDVTALGGFTCLTLFTIVAAVCLLVYRRHRQAIVLTATILLAEASSDLLKLVYARDRPELVPHGAYVYSHSFPSGHSTLSATTYLTLAAILSSLEPRRRVKAFFFAIAVLVMVSVGFSRVYLGVHWPTDVLAGWTLGAAWALAARTLLGVWQATPGGAPPDPPER